MRKAYSIIITIVLAAAVGGGVGYIIPNFQKADGEIKEDEEKASQKDNDLGEKDASESKSESEDKSIVISSPLEDDTVSKSSFKVTGKAMVFENQLTIRVKDGKGKKLLEEVVTTDATDTGKFGDFSLNLKVVTSSESGTIEAFENSAKDGSEINKVSVSVKFSD